MRINEEHWYDFSFDIEDGQVVALQTRAHTKEEAVSAIRNQLHSMLADLAMEFPTTSPATGPVLTGANTGPTLVPPEVMELRINTLIEDISKFRKPLGTPADTVKTWTKIDYKPENYVLIIGALETLQADLVNKIHDAQEGK